MLLCAGITQVLHHGVKLDQPVGAAVSSAVFCKWSVVQNMLPAEGYKARVVQEEDRAASKRKRGVKHWAES